MPTLTQRLTQAVQRELRRAWREYGRAYNPTTHHYVRVLRYLRRRSQRAALAHALRIATLLANITLAGQRAAYLARANGTHRPSLRRASWLSY